MMNVQSSSFTGLDLIDELVFRPFRYFIKNRKPELESQEYAAHRFLLNEKKIIFRIAKITLTKTGQFLSIWKRNEQGITAPFDIKDDLDFLMIVTKTPRQLGAFIFPKKVLHEHRILSYETRDGKRGIRVYPIWDETINKQAQKTQLWQTEFFIDLTNENEIDLNRARDLLTNYNDSRNGAVTKIKS